MYAACSVITCLPAIGASRSTGEAAARFRQVLGSDQDRTGQFKSDVTRSGVFANEGVLEKLPHGCPEQPLAPHRQCWQC